METTLASAAGGGSHGNSGAATNLKNRIISTFLCLYGMLPAVPTTKCYMETLCLPVTNEGFLKFAKRMKCFVKRSISSSYGVYAVKTCIQRINKIFCEKTVLAAS